MSQLDLTNAHLTWCLDILNRIKTIIDSEGWTEDQKLITVKWLVKQALKAERED